jgi:hypothetical protein
MVNMAEANANWERLRSAAVEAVRTFTIFPSHKVNLRIL